METSDIFLILGGIFIIGAGLGFYAMRIVFGA
jgi:hypothetical protein